MSSFYNNSPHLFGLFLIPWLPSIYIFYSYFLQNDKPIRLPTSFIVNVLYNKMNNIITYQPTCVALW